MQHGVQKTFSKWSCFYFIFVVVVGAFFLINLTLAIVKAKYSLTVRIKDKIEESLQVNGYDIDDFKRWGLYISNKNPDKGINQADLAFKNDQNDDNFKNLFKKVKKFKKNLMEISDPLNLATSLDDKPLAKNFLYDW